jgi:hypothetical protein
MRQPLPKVSAKDSRPYSSDWKVDLYIFNDIISNNNTIHPSPAHQDNILSSSFIQDERSSHENYLFSYQSIGIKVKVKLFSVIILFNGRSAERKDDTADQQMLGPTEKRTTHPIQGKYEECIDIMEEIVSIKKSVYGIGHSEF